MATFYMWCCNYPFTPTGVKRSLYSSQKIKHMTQYLTVNVVQRNVFFSGSSTPSWAQDKAGLHNRWTYRYNFDVLGKACQLLGLISCKMFCVSETETDSESTMYYVIGAILYRTLGVILPPPKWVLLIPSSD